MLQRVVEDVRETFLSNDLTPEMKIENIKKATDEAVNLTALLREIFSIKAEYFAERKKSPNKIKMHILNELVGKTVAQLNKIRDAKQIDYHDSFMALWDGVNTAKVKLEKYHRRHDLLYGLNLSKLFAHKTPLLVQIIDKNILSNAALNDFKQQCVKNETDLGLRS